MMQRYQQKDHEWFFVHFYNVLLTTGDLAKLFLARDRNLTTFLGTFASANCVCHFAHDAKGVWFAGWHRPIGSVVEFAMWVRKDKHYSVAALKNLNLLYDQTLKISPAIIGITKQPELEEMHLKLGYRKVGVLPKLLDGEDAHIFAMTRESRADVKVLKYGRLRQLVRGEKGGVAHGTIYEN